MVFLEKTSKKSPSKTKVDKAGETLFNNAFDKNYSEALKTLSLWRVYHAAPLNSFTKTLKTRAQKISPNKEFIVAQRLKRTPSIVLKLQVHKTMRLSTMQDIGGLRAILDNTENVYSLTNLYRSSRTKHELFSLDDYIEKPKADGYRGVHLVYKLTKTPSIFLEIQMRSYLQHIWATGVEVFGTLQESSFKSGHGEKKWFKLFSLVSSIFALKEKTPLMKSHQRFSKKSLLTRAKKLIHELQVIEQLSVYTGLYKLEPLKFSGGRTGNYNLISLNSKTNLIKIESFPVNKIEQASKAYMQLEKKYLGDNSMNVVLVNSGDIKKLKLSYPNYFMDTKELLKNLSLIAMDKYL